MPELKCTVETCVHNKCSCCDMGSIDVNGESALVKGETCCNSFSDSSMGNYSNSTKAATMVSDIQCSALHCMYNENHKCNAGSVEVQGSNACQCCDTECGSFVERK